MRRLQIVFIVSGFILGAPCGSTTDSTSTTNFANDGLDASPAAVGISDSCQVLIDKVCGAGLDASVCELSLECENARYTAALAPERCPERNADRRYVACEDRPPENSGCTELVIKVCGSEDVGAAACNGTEACANARDVAEAMNDSDCRQALGDITLFPACQPQ